MVAVILDTSKTNNVVEYFLGMDEFNHPKVYTNEDATYTLLIRLILLEPGTYVNHPNMGVGIVSKYRYAMEDKMDQLKEDITTQVGLYLPEFQDVTVTVAYNKISKEINIGVSIDKYVYELTYSQDTNTLASMH